MGNLLPIYSLHHQLQNLKPSILTITNLCSSFLLVVVSCASWQAYSGWQAVKSLVTRVHVQPLLHVAQLVRINPVRATSSLALMCFVSVNYKYYLRLSSLLASKFRLKILISLPKPTQWSLELVEYNKLFQADFWRTRILPKWNTLVRSHDKNGREFSFLFVHYCFTQKKWKATHRACITLWEKN